MMIILHDLTLLGASYESKQVSSEKMLSLHLAVLGQALGALELAGRGGYVVHPSVITSITSRIPSSQLVVFDAGFEPSTVTLLSHYLDQEHVDSSFQKVNM
jgi:hypothetical protein